MKTKKILILLVVLFMPFMVNAKTCDTSKITIDSINLDSKSNTVSELTPATASGKNVNLDLSMAKQGDNAEYSIVVKNDSDEDFELDSNSLGIKSNYVTYTLDAGNDPIVKANSTKTVLLRVEYSHTVPANEYKSGVYRDNKDLVVNLSNGRQLLSNPSTGMNILFYVLLVGGLGVITYIVIKKKKQKVMMVIILGIIMIPASVYAICKCELKVNSSVELQRTGFTGVIYRNSEYSIYPGESILSSDVWMPYNNDSVTEVNTKELIPNRPYFTTEEDCMDYVENGGVDIFRTQKATLERPRGFSYGYNACKKVRRTIGEYVSKASDLNKNYYIRDEIENDIVTKAQVCFYTDKEVCLTPTEDDGEQFYLENYNKIQGEKNWFESNEGSCEFSDSESEDVYAMCNSDSLWAVDYSEAGSYDRYCSPYKCGYRLFEAKALN